jgi:hypothetical protein
LVYKHLVWAESQKPSGLRPATCGDALSAFGVFFAILFSPDLPLEFSTNPKNPFLQNEPTVKMKKLQCYQSKIKMRAPQ